MTSKIFQTNNQNHWLNTSAASAKGTMTKSLELAARAVAPMTGLQKITIRPMSSVIKPPILVKKMASWVFLLH